MGSADLHIHTIYSKDGTATIPSVLRQAKKIGLDVIAITDHDEISGALQAKQLAPQFGLQVIPGVEITTVEGDLLALNIQTLIPAGLSLLETILQVGEQGGFCIAPHPGATGMGMKSLSIASIHNVLQVQEVQKILLGIETYNASILDRKSNLVAQIWARRMGIPQTGSSDAHILATIGLGTTIFPGKTIPDLISALQMGMTQVHTSPQWSSVQVIGKWLVDYLVSAPEHLALNLAWRQQ